MRKISEHLFLIALEMEMRPNIGRGPILYLAISWLGQIYKWGRGIRYIFRSLPRLHQVSSSLNAHLVALSMVDLLFALQDKIKIFCEFFLTEINLFH